MLPKNRKDFAPVVLDRIRRDYSKMLNAGATTVWETADGAVAFENAGSLERYRGILLSVATITGSVTGKRRTFWIIHSHKEIATDSYHPFPKSYPTALFRRVFYK